MRSLLALLKRKGILPTRFIVTDLTRFANPQIVCLAGIDPDTGQCIRPQPYLQAAACRRLQLRPGCILAGRLAVPRHLHGPHQEDRRHKGLRLKGVCDSEMFKAALAADLSSSLQAGFALPVPPLQNRIPIDQPPNRSLITLKALPASLELLENPRKPGRLRLSFTDAAGQRYQAMPVTDLGLHQYAQQHPGSAARLTAFWRSQPDIYLRAGLGRGWAKPGEDEEAHGLQINGVYSFPAAYPGLRVAV